MRPEADILRCSHQLFSLGTHMEDKAEIYCPNVHASHIGRSVGMRAVVRSGVEHILDKSRLS